MQEIIGVDSSVWQGNHDWEKCKAAGARFAFIRAGSINKNTGVMYSDYKFLRNAELCNIPHGFYWFMRPKFSGREQAKYFLDLIGHTDRTFAPVLDIEVSGASYDTIRRNTLDFCLEVKDQLNIWPIIYTRATWWNPVIGSNTWAQNCLLWVARYHSGIEGPWSDNDRYRPCCWDDWTFWQWSADGNNRGAEFGAESDDIDLNRFNGSEQDFAHLTGTEFPTPQPGGTVTITVTGVPSDYEVKLVRG